MEIIYGVNPVLEVLRAGLRHCHEVMIAKGRKESLHERIAKEAGLKKIKIRETTREEILQLTRTDKHQGVAARVDPFPYASLDSIIDCAKKENSKAFIVILDGITDPQNLGSIIRTALLLGVHGIILPKDNSAPVTPVVVKASAGATEYLPIAQVTNLARTISLLKEKGMWVAGAEAGGEKSIYDVDFKGFDTVLVLGSEGSGIRRLVKESCDYILYIPMQGEIESYNVSVAGALFMGEVARQRRVPYNNDECKTRTK